MNKTKCKIYDNMNENKKIIENISQGNEYMYFCGSKMLFYQIFNTVIVMPKRMKSDKKRYFNYSKVPSPRVW